jgi:hypothetical protein
MSDNFNSIVTLFTDAYETERAAVALRGEIEVAPHAESLTPVMRRLAHTGTYYISQLSGVEYRTYRDLLASIGLELLRDQRLVSYRGTVMEDCYLITVTPAGAERIADATHDHMVCPLAHGVWAREYGDYTYGWDLSGAEPIYMGEQVRVLDLCQDGECACGATLVGSHKAMPCPSCGRITWGT